MSSSGADALSQGRDGIIVDGLSVHSSLHEIAVVTDVSFGVKRGGAIGIVGESGSGKTTIAFALLGYARPGMHISARRLEVDGVNLLQLSEEQIRSLRGPLVSFLPQNPATAFNPARRIGGQLDEVLNAAYPAAARAELITRACRATQLPDDGGFLRRYPHELSGGQLQRLAIAMALVAGPSVVVMDEPTTGLDVITQASLLDFIQRLRSEEEVTIVYVSHDLAVVRNVVDRVAVCYGGHLVEEGPVEAIFRAPWHPYTRRLLEAIPRVQRPASLPRGISGSSVDPWNRPSGCAFSLRCDFRNGQTDRSPPPLEREGDRQVRCWRWRELGELDHPGQQLGLADSGSWVGRSGLSEVLAEPLMRVRSLHARYGQRGQPRREAVLVAISFELARGSCLAIVGESGSGKSTLARCLVGLHRPESGEIRFKGRVLPDTARRRDLESRRLIQIIFQDPDGSLNPRMTVGQALARPLRLFLTLRDRERRARSGELLEQVGLPASHLSRYPSQLSGGEKQRVAIARALAARPELLICDEITSSLDVAVQATILELLDELRRATGMSLVFVSHDLAVVRSICDRVVVLRGGVVQEDESAGVIFANPQNQYTRQLLAAVPELHPDDYPLELSRDVPDP